MTLSMVFIVVLMLIVVVPTGLINLKTGEPDPGTVRAIDEQAFLDLEARGADFPIVSPVAPAEWTANSARRTQVDGEPASVVGWVTEEEGYLQLTQTGVGVEDAVRGVDAYPRELSGTETIEGREVQKYESTEHDVRDLWVADTGQTRLLVSGVATEEDFRQLMDAALSAEPIDVSDSR